MEAIRLLASNSAFRRRKRGRLASALMELSVRSMQSCWSYIERERYANVEMEGTYSRNTEVFNCRYFVAL